MFYMSSFREVAMQPVLDQQKLKTLVYYIEVVQHFALPFPFPWIFSSFVKVLLNYLPGIRDPVRKFLVSLRDWPVGKNFDFIIWCFFFKILISQLYYRCRWGTVRCLTPCTRRRWRSSSSFIGRFPKPQWSGRDAKAAVHNTGDTLVLFGNPSK